MKNLLAGLAGLLLAGSLAGQPAELPFAENLVVEGVPKIPTALAEDAGRYAEFREVAFLSWHPSRREMLIATRFANTYQVHRVAAPGAARTQLTFFKENVYFGVAYDPRAGDSFVFLRDTGGDEQYQLYRYDFADGKTTLVTDGKSRNTDPVWSRAGDRLVYGSTLRNGKDVDLRVVDPRDPKSGRLLASLSGGGWTPTDWSPDGGKVLAIEGISINEAYVWIFDAATGEKTLVTPKTGGPKIAYGGGRFSRDGKGIYVTTDRDSEFQRLADMDLATRRLKFLTPDTADVDEFDLSSDGKTVALVRNEKGVSALTLLDAETGRARAISGLPVGVIFGLRWHKDGTAVGFTVASARSTYDAYSLDAASGRVERWTFSETGGLNAETFAEPELITWKSFDGLEVTGFLYRPPAARFPGRRPVVVEIHGGPEGQARPEFLGRENYRIQELGVAILFPNIRGSSGYGKKFLTLDNGILRENSYKDIGALFDWIRTRPDLNADRVMVTGGSYGGHMTLAVSTLYSDRIRCALAEVGPSNLVTFLENTSGYRQDLRRVEYGDERDPKMRAFLERIAPLNNAEKIRKPLFIVQGQNDPRVPRTESEQMVARVRKNGTPVWYLMAKDEGHGFGKKGNRDTLFYTAVLFMKQFLLN